MADRASVSNLVVSQLAFGVFMVLLLTLLGGGVGTPELLIWLALLMLGVCLIARRHRSSRARRGRQPVEV